MVYDKWFNSILVSEETIFVQDSEFIASSLALPDPAWSMINLQARLRNVEVDIEMYRFIKMLTVLNSTRFCICLISAIRQNLMGSKS